MTTKCLIDLISSTRRWPIESFKCAHNKIVPIHKLQPNPDNPNHHPERQIELLAKIIDYQGQRAPIVVSNRSGFITKGHGRLMALQLLGWNTAAVDYQDYENEAQEHADLVADNKIAELSKTDDEIMKKILDDGDFDFELFGLDDFDIGDLDIANQVNAGSESDEWVGMPDFEPGEKEIKLIMIFNTELERDQYVEKHGIPITNKRNNQWTSRI